MTSLKRIFNRLAPRGFIMGDDFLNLLQAWRCVWLSGRFGGGKTSLAFILAAWLVHMGYVERIHSNVTSPLVSRVRVPLRDAALVIDESWQVLTSWKAVADYAGFVRHLNLYLLLPSVYPPHARMRFLSVQRTFNAQVAGIPVWLYRWTLGSGAIKERGFFLFWNPMAIFPYYNQGIVGGDAGIAAALKGTYDFYRRSQNAEQAIIEREIAAQIAAIEGDHKTTQPIGANDARQPKNRGGTRGATTSKIEIDTSEVEAVLSDAAADISDAARIIRKSAK